MRPKRNFGKICHTPGFTAQTEKTYFALTHHNPEIKIKKRKRRKRHQNTTERVSATDSMHTDARERIQSGKLSSEANDSDQKQRSTLPLPGAREVSFQRSARFLFPQRRRPPWLRKQSFPAGSFYGARGKRRRRRRRRRNSRWLAH